MPISGGLAAAVAESRLFRTACYSMNRRIGVCVECVCAWYRDTVEDARRGWEDCRGDSRSDSRGIDRRAADAGKNGGRATLKEGEDFQRLVEGRMTRGETLA